MLSKNILISWIISKFMDTPRNDHEVGEEENLEVYDDDRQEDQFEYEAFKRPSGRPKQRRRQSEGEASTSSNSSKATRKYGEIHCSRCGKTGHNIRRCMNEATNDAPDKRGNRRTSRGPNASDAQVEAPSGPSRPIIGSQDSIILGPSVPVSVGSIRSASHSSAQSPFKASSDKAKSTCTSVNSFSVDFPFKLVTRIKYHESKILRA
ncbi:hypothetical protein CDL15_Pgr003072 [Punica granatum]|uniref:CCHC-type domain-containing protein n=1 Tax=Punica granatum TaxID=22663 RepID=A0A218X344_PUNGR|nr:hypothetical protein CDL15_Pgr003072 [Punica granatum]